MPNDPSQDKDFLTAKPEEQHAYLMQTDQNYASAKPEEQQAYLAHLTGRTTPAPVAPNLQTGAGMEQQAVAQSRKLFTGGTPNNPIGSAKPTYSGAPPSLLQKAGDEQAYNQTQRGAAQNRALKSPMPFSNASMLYAPVAAGRAIAGAKLGSYASDKAGLGPWGNLIAGALGGAAASYTPGGVTKAAQRLTRGPGGTADVSVSPWTIASRELEGVVPKNTDIPGGSGGTLPSSDEFYSNRAEELAQRPDELTQAVKDRIANRIPNRVPATQRGDPFEPSTGAPTTGGAAKPFEPLIYESEAEANQIAQRNANLKRQASAAGTFHAAQGSASKPTNLQQRIGRKFPWITEEDQ